MFSNTLVTALTWRLTMLNYCLSSTKPIQLLPANCWHGTLCPVHLFPLPCPSLFLWAEKGSAVQISAFFGQQKMKVLHTAITKTPSFLLTPKLTFQFPFAVIEFSQYKPDWKDNYRLCNRLLLASTLPCSWPAPLLFFFVFVSHSTDMLHVNSQQQQ